MANRNTKITLSHHRLIIEHFTGENNSRVITMRREGDYDNEVILSTQEARDAGTALIKHADQVEKLIKKAVKKAAKAAKGTK